MKIHRYCETCNEIRWPRVQNNHASLLQSLYDKYTNLVGVEFTLHAFFFFSKCQFYVSVHNVVMIFHLNQIITIGCCMFLPAALVKHVGLDKEAKDWLIQHECEVRRASL